MDDTNLNYSYWSMTEGAFNCLIDEKRTEAFKRAIKNTVKKGDVVVDMGTGTGILAMFAASAGAKKVYAIENDEKNISTLKKTFKLNKLDSIITILNGDATKISLPEKVDVIIGEMIATGLIEELQLQAMNNVLKYTKLNYKVLLNRYLCGIDLVYNTSERYGYKFNIIRYEYPDMISLISNVFTDTVYYKDVDFSKINTDDLVDEKIELLIKKDGLINGLRLSGKTIFSDKSEFKGSFAYSYPIILPLEDTEVKMGDKFVINIKYKLCGGFNSLNYSICKI